MKPALCQTVRRARFFCRILAGLLTLDGAAQSGATLYRRISGEDAVIEADRTLREGGIAYRAVLKETAGTARIDRTAPWAGRACVVFHLARNPGRGTDKYTYPLVLGSADFAPAAAGGTGFTGYALRVPGPADFSPPAGKLLVVQWWQGRPYGPPLRMALTGGDDHAVSYRFFVLNNDTLGNPSSVSRDIGGGQIPRETWTPFVVWTKFDFQGGGEVTVWQEGRQVFTWHGKLGYNPATIPYRKPAPGSPPPNRKLQIEFGLYREQADQVHEIGFDEVRFADIRADAQPDRPGTKPGDKLSRD
ncbi:MAG: hypothetical protein ACHQ5A_07675 [Opitutales bacterium]